jgi:hypothetical protein
MIKHEFVIDKREVIVNDDLTIQPIAYKGHIEPVKVIEITEMSKEFMSHKFNRETLKIMFWSQEDIELDYIGG